MKTPSLTCLPVVASTMSQHKQLKPTQEEVIDISDTESTIIIDSEDEGTIEINSSDDDDDVDEDLENAMLVENEEKNRQNALLDGNPNRENFNKKFQQQREPPIQ